MKQHRQSNNERQKQRHHITMPRLTLLKHSKKSHNRTHERFTHSNKWKQYYGSRTWRDLRESQLMSQPLCECCLAHDKITPATSVHHVCVFGSAPTDDERWYWFLKPDNLLSVCNECHTKIHNGMYANESTVWIKYWPFDDVE